MADKKIRNRKSGELKKSLLSVSKSLERQLISAAKTGRVDILQKILKKPVDLNFQDDEKNLTFKAIDDYRMNEIPLHGKNWRNVQPPAGRRGKSGNTALMWACQLNHAKVAKALLAAGADPAVTNLLGETALHLLDKNADLIDQLLAAGAAVDARNAWGATPLMLALVHDCDGYLNSVGRLLEHGADPDIKTVGGDNAFDVAEAVLIDSVFIRQMKDISNKVKKPQARNAVAPKGNETADIQLGTSNEATENRIARLRKLRVAHPIRGARQDSG